MKPFPPKTILQNAVIGITLMLCPTTHAQDSAPPKKLNIADFPGEIVDKIVVPVPAEVFVVLDKLGAPDWNGQIFTLPEDKDQKPDRISLALRFGALVAEGFVAVQAENVSEIQRIGEDALQMAKSLGLGDAVEPHSHSIIEAAEAGDWQKVRSELDLTQTTVKTTLEELRDGDVGNLVSMGGWIRGTNAVTSLISENFTHDKAELLNQPTLIIHFMETIDAMAPAVKTHDKVKAIRSGLEKLEAVLEESDEEISADGVTAMGSTCQGLLELFYFPAAEKNEGDNEEE